MKYTTLIAILVVFLLLTGSVLAMSSTNYRLNWFTPLTGGGGGAASSTNYAANFTVGQSAIGASTGATYNACLGYWCGNSNSRYTVYLPLTLKN